MKEHLSSFLFGRLGLVVGFTLCYIYVALPARAPGPAAVPQFVTVPVLPAGKVEARPWGGQRDWRPSLIQPMIPPKVLGK